MATILLVDDDENTLQTYRVLLEVAGYQVASARNGVEALAKISETAVDLVMTDMSMPLMDGVSLTRVLRADPRHCSVPVVLMSAAEAPADDGLWNAFFRKPVAWRAVAHTVRELVAVPSTPAAITRGSDPVHAAVPTSDLDSMPLVAMGDQQLNPNDNRESQDPRFTRASARESK
ncbi:response regulator [Burkholderia cenocepacia]|uniref:response regulator n=1 Tax=Burkholderia cenocepacia TaxID=95486 RepID=UPI002B24ABB1|nr:response regulator [Burkholderia cenocepacia]MEB2497363.1 response regulator [Burkholderia cenocepacia]